MYKLTLTLKKASREPFSINSVTIIMGLPENRMHNVQTHKPKYSSQTNTSRHQEKNSFSDVPVTTIRKLLLMLNLVSYFPKA